MSDELDIDAKRVYLGPVVLWYRVNGQHVKVLFLEEEGETIFCYHCDNGLPCEIHEHGEGGEDPDLSDVPKAKKAKKDGSSAPASASDGSSVA